MGCFVEQMDKQDFSNCTLKTTHLSTYCILQNNPFINLSYGASARHPLKCEGTQRVSSSHREPNHCNSVEGRWGQKNIHPPPKKIPLVFYLFGRAVKYSVLWFSIYLVLWIRSTNLAQWITADLKSFKLFQVLVSRLWDFYSFQQTSQKMRIVFFQKIYWTSYKYIFYNKRQQIFNCNKHILILCGGEESQPHSVPKLSIANKIDKIMGSLNPTLHGLSNCSELPWVCLLEAIIMQNAALNCCTFQTHLKVQRRYNVGTNSAHFCT